MGESPAWSSMALNGKDWRKMAWLTFVLAVFAAGGVWQVAVALSSGVAHVRGSDYVAAVDPIGFWITVGLLSLGTALILAIAMLGARTILRGVYRPSFAELEEARTATPPITRRLRRK